jgi:hypothetical protein
MATNKPVRVQVKGAHKTSVIALIEILASGKYRVTILIHLRAGKAYRVYDVSEFWDSTERNDWIDSFGARIPTILFARLEDKNHVD